ncbi:DUF983 domain-containing protein [Niabella ginsengisoli]|uniref:DUF983 domain-containing protein n=1 Tax=Niabella ginsengisoli TaxID=522298 RepID=A0ABS9SLT1_9BACT|nr:DUF983 domain-containing protein [Niabella ginsengisoli]MCH5599339.1 DUF983 domain-containing protein [Niabella ginsengisoli]
MSTEIKASRSYVGAVLGCYCPRCREGKLFEKPLSLKLSGMLKMNKACPVCGQPTEIEVGFFYGTSYVSYMLAVALCVASAIAWWVIVGFSLQDNRFIYWIIFNALLLVVLQPWLMRLSRSLWLSWFVKYDPNWREHGPIDVSERINKDQGNNW